MRTDLALRRGESIKGGTVSIGKRAHEFERRNIRAATLGLTRRSVINITIFASADASTTQLHNQSGIPTEKKATTVRPVQCGEQ